SQVPPSLSPPTSSAVTIPSFSLGGTSPSAQASKVCCAPASASPLRYIGFLSNTLGGSSPFISSSTFASLPPSFQSLSDLSSAPPGKKKPCLARCKICGELTSCKRNSVASGPS